MNTDANVGMTVSVGVAMGINLTTGVGSMGLHLEIGEEGVRLGLGTGV